MDCSKTTREAARKLARQKQRLVVVNWPIVARNSMDRFVLQQTRCVYATARKQLRIWNGREFRPLTNHEYGVLWNCVRAEIENQNAKISVCGIKFGLRAVAVMAPRAEIVARMRGVAR